MVIGAHPHISGPQQFPSRFVTTTRCPHYSGSRISGPHTTTVPDPIRYCDVMSMSPAVPDHESCGPAHDGEWTFAAPPKMGWCYNELQIHWVCIKPYYYDVQRTYWSHGVCLANPNPLPNRQFWWRFGTQPPNGPVSLDNPNPLPNIRLMAIRHPTPNGPVPLDKLHIHW